MHHFEFLVNNFAVSLTLPLSADRLAEDGLI
jgi:hypothetical protein